MTDPATIAAVMRSPRLAYLSLLPLALAVVLPSCTGGPVSSAGLALKDPAGIVDDADRIRALVFRTETEDGTAYSCEGP
ncbi:MAG: hypothetical protein ACOCUS_00315, partial [Polyangiales bacterium]